MESILPVCMEVGSAVASRGLAVWGTAKSSILGMDIVDSQWEPSAVGFIQLVPGQWWEHWNGRGKGGGHHMNSMTDWRPDTDKAVFGGSQKQVRNTMFWVNLSFGNKFPKSRAQDGYFYSSDWFEDCSEKGMREARSSRERRPPKNEVSTDVSFNQTS